MAYLSKLELLGVINVIDCDLTVGQEVVALDLPGQQQTTYNRVGDGKPL